ncbi:ZIP family metal transporter [Sphingomonas sp. TX0543]|uniref:ZIP family metal transporter n=1 Tax=Sphingomonas sp. TX0543 TaxID=3399682 RepID=UPI003AFA9DDF
MWAILYTLFPLAAVIIGAVLSVVRRPGPAFVSGMQHLAAGVVFAAAASEVLPQIKHGASPVATLIGGLVGLGVMLLLKVLEGRAKGPVAMLGAVGIDIFVDGLVLGLAFLAGEKAGLLLTVALTLEVMFLGLTVTAELGETIVSRWRIVGITAALGLLLPFGAWIAAPVALFPPTVIVGFLSFGMVALLYLVTEELLVEALFPVSANGTDLRL